MSEGIGIVFIGMEDFLRVTNLQAIVMNLNDVLIHFKLLVRSQLSLHLALSCYVRVASENARQTERCFKVRDHELPQGCPKYHHCCEAKMVIR
jgi:hypothetical protein